MPYVHIVLALALVEFFVFGLAVARARETYNVPAPATTGHEVFERYFRVQMNTLEQLVIFVPSLLLFARYVSPWLAALLGLAFIIGRALYFRGYVRAAKERHLGFMVSVIPNLTLLVGGLLGAVWALVRYTPG
ncbi:MAG TPA: MAPEG family protein [Steroidobacteraceae bacterium]|nr:MAPEG family protein [Steroidobacteraceae bacterium]